MTPERAAVPEERHVEFDTVFNFRDLGGYRGDAGRTVKWRTVFRADGLHRFSETDLVRMADMGVHTVLDLRTRIELEERGRIGDAGGGAERVEIRYHHLPVIERVWEGSLDDEHDPARFLADRYLDMLEEGRDALGQALTIIGDPAATPLVFHCAAGKDRTGVLAALTLSLLGVADDDVVRDYGLSRGAMGRMIDWLRVTYPERVEKMAEQPTVFLEAPEDAMRLFLAELRARYGSPEEYAASLGIGGDEVAALREHLLA
jgi:protein tyrosine/serine phosphatase